jgi:hypothetical protein
MGGRGQCLSMDEPAAIAAAKEFAARNAPLDAMNAAEAIKLARDLYANAKHALNRWCRRVAVRPQIAVRSATPRVGQFKSLLAPSTESLVISNGQHGWIHCGVAAPASASGGSSGESLIEVQSDT